MLIVHIIFLLIAVSAKTNDWTPVKIMLAIYLILYFIGKIAYN